MKLRPKGKGKFYINPIRIPIISRTIGKLLINKVAVHDHRNRNPFPSNG